MADLLPSKSSDADDGRDDRDPRVIGLDSDEADDLLGAISSSTARSVLASLHEAPATPSDLATDVDTSLQNIQYHLGNLSDAGLIEVADTRYSEKGREMKVYTPSDRALVVVAGREDETRGLESVLTQLIGGVGVLGLGSVVVNRLARTGTVFPFGAAGGGSADGAEHGGAGSGGAPNESTASDVAVSYTGESVDVNATGGQQTTAADATATTAEGDGGYSIAEATATESTKTAQTVTEEPTRTVAEEATKAVTEAATQTPTEAVASTPTPTATAEPTTTAVQTATETAAQVSGSPGVADTIGSLSPGTLFFLGGLTVLLVWVALVVVRD